MKAEASHVVLFGDSIFDNKRYVSGAPDVVAHVREGFANRRTAFFCC